MGLERRRGPAPHHVASVRIAIRRGLELRVAGQPAAIIESAPTVPSVALLGRDYPGLRPRLLVQPGERVALGQTLFIDKRDERIRFTAPGTGTVVEVNRGARRVLQSVVIELEDGAADGTPHPAANLPPAAAPGALDATDIREHLLACGLWTALRARPYGRIPTADAQPQAIFVTATDTRPLAADPALVVAPHAEAFEAGLAVLSRLTDGPVYLCTASNWTGPIGADVPRVVHAQFDGPHPAGLPGTHIHHLAPVGSERSVWHIGHQDVIAFGKLFTEGGLWVERAVALGGTGFRRPRVLRTRLGAHLGRLVQDELTEAEGAAGTHRLISGSMLDGHAAAGVEAWLGRYHQQVNLLPSTMPPGHRHRPGLSLGGMLAHLASDVSPLRRLIRPRRRLTTSLGGHPTAMIPVEAFEQVIPMDILAVPLLRALLIGDTVTAQALGCLELEPDDLALCTFLCPGKNDYGAVLRVALDRIDREG